MVDNIFDDFSNFARSNNGVSKSTVENYFKDMTRYVIEERNTRFREVDVFSRLILDRIIFLGSCIDDDVANVIVAQLLYLATINNENISLYINSPGGNVHSGFAIYDTMQYVAPNIQTVCIGQCASMAAVILASGEKGMRYALPHSRVMIHQPLGEAKGQATEIEITYKEIMKVKEEIYNVLSIHTGQKYQKICEDSERDYWMNAKEAVDYGIIDSVYSEYKK